MFRLEHSDERASLRSELFLHSLAAKAPLAGITKCAVNLSMHYDIHLSERYDGFAAEFWGLMGGNTPESDLSFFENAIRVGGGRALDLTCGSGKHMVPYCKAGLQVDGVDASQPLLDVCKSRAAEIGENPDLYCQMMQSLDLPHHYQTIFITVGSFMLLKDRDDALKTLVGCLKHLLPGGKLYVSVFRPKEADDPAYRGRRTMGPSTRPEDGATISVECWTENVDSWHQVITERRRYTVTRPGQPSRIQEAVMYLRWYGKDELLTIFELAGFTDPFVHQDFTMNAAFEWKDELVFSGTKPHRLLPM